jgi:hypothetical protein
MMAYVTQQFQARDTRTPNAEMAVHGPGERLMGWRSKERERTAAQARGRQASKALADMAARLRALAGI